MNGGLAGWLRRWGHQLLSRAPEPLRAYDSYLEASRDCEGYEVRELVQTVARKTENYRAALGMAAISGRQAVQNLFVLTYLSEGGPLHVLELGGACGATFFEVDHFLPKRIARWVVLETPAMVRAAQERPATDRLVFTPDLRAGVQALDKRQVFLAQGSLCYLPDPLQTLTEVASLCFQALYLTRTPVFEGDSAPVVTRQVTSLRDHGPGPTPADVPDRRISVPLTLLSQGALLEPPAPDYERVLVFEESSPEERRVGPNSVRTRNLGVLMRRAA